MGILEDLEENEFLKLSFTEKKTLDYFEKISKRKIILSFEELFEVIDKTIGDTSTMAGKGLSYCLKQAILLEQQCKVLGIDKQKFFENLKK